MSDWRNYQTDILHYFNGSKYPESLNQKVLPGGQIKNTQEAINVYKEGRPARLFDVLSSTYECLWWTLGDQQFFDLCMNYIQAYPSIYYNISNYGESLSEFLNNHSLLNKHPYLIDIARFEYLVHEVFHTKTEIPSCELDLGLLSFESKLDLSNAYRIAAFNWDIYDHWLKRQSEDDDSVIQIEKNKLYYWFYKNSESQYVLELSEFEAEVLKGLQKGLTLEQAFDTYPGFPDQLEPSDIENFMAKLVESKLILNITP